MKKANGYPEHRVWERARRRKRSEDERAGLATSFFELAEPFHDRIGLGV